FIHAVPDTGALDFRPVDIVENTTFYGIAFRSTGQAFYKNSRAGARHFKIFLTPDQNLPAEQQQAMAQTVVQDINVTLEAGHRYTFILWGYSRAGSSPAMQLTILDDNPGDPGSQVALRLVNAGAGLGAVDGFQYARGTATGTSCPGGGTPAETATWTGLAELTASAYVQTAPGTKCYRVTPAGSGTTLFADAMALAGAPPNTVTGHQALPGTTQAGSAVSGFVVPRSVLGSKAPQTLTTPTIIFLWDRRPPNSEGF
ncbi:MAG TPA: DUF4397 domain-containing protein, partial [Gemmatimonadales bacterium]